jgi:hypothetical protein
MKSDDTAASLDREDDDGDESALFGSAGAGTEPADGVVDPDADPDAADEDLLEAELGELDLPIGVDDDEEFEAELLEADSEEDDEVETEMALLQELGIDLDAPDDVESVVELGVGLPDEDALDDEVAA